MTKTSPTHVPASVCVCDTLIIQSELGGQEEARYGQATL